MFYTFLYPLHSELSWLNVLRYPSFRIIMAALTALLVTLFLYPAFIRRVKTIRFGQVIRKDGPEAHLKKEGTPTMGGLLILVAIVIACVLWADARHTGMWALLFLTCGYGAIGFYDDYKKVKHQSSDGLSARWKLFWQFLIGGIVLFFYQSGMINLEYSPDLSLPFVAINVYQIPLSNGLYFVFALVVIVGTSNAVNLTDGLDGLAIGPAIVSAFVFLVLAYAAGTTIADFNIAAYLRIADVKNAAELAVFCAALIGAGIGFLWYNSYPALIFMGDVGALALGGALGLLAIFTKHEILSAVLHGLFLAEILSVMIQVTSFKLTGKRIFRMAPIHHHFEKAGWPEPKIIVRFWIISVMLALLALASLKLR